MKKLILIFTLLSISFRISYAAGTSGAALLKIPTGARAAGMAEAFSAMDNDMNAMTYNPASLSSLKNNDIQTMYMNGLVDTSYLFLGGAHPMSKGSLGVSLFYFDGGDIEIGTLNGSAIETQTKKAQQDYVGTLGYGLPLTETLGLGFNLKVIHSELAEEFSATAFAGDAGVTYQTPVAGWRLSGAVQNIGTELKYDAEGSDLPMLARLGTQYSLGLREKDNLVGALDAVFTKDEAPEIRVGAEYLLQSMLALRAGYRYDTENAPDQISGFTTGVGFRWSNYCLDYAFGLQNEFEDQHLFTLGIRF